MKKMIKKKPKLKARRKGRGVIGFLKIVWVCPNCCNFNCAGTNRLDNSVRCMYCKEWFTLRV